MVKWAVELSQFDVDNALRTTIKVQALVDFISEALATQQTETLVMQSASIPVVQVT